LKKFRLQSRLQNFQGSYQVGSSRELLLPEAFA
jgi:hypothetical protein